MKSISQLEVDNLIRSLTDKSLPKSQWNHETHVLVALWYNWNLEAELAFSEVKRKIIEYNDHIGTRNTESSGYHETLTRFWMIHISDFLKSGNHKTFIEAANEFLNSKESRTNLPLEYYSEERLFSKEARMSWVDGDIKKIAS